MGSQLFDNLMKSNDILHGGISAIRIQKNEVPQGNKSEFTFHLMIPVLKRGIGFSLLNFLSLFWFKTQLKIIFDISFY